MCISAVCCVHRCVGCRSAHRFVGEGLHKIGSVSFAALAPLVCSLNFAVHSLLGTCSAATRPQHTAFYSWYVDFALLLPSHIRTLQTGVPRVRFRDAVANLGLDSADHLLGDVCCRVSGCLVRYVLDACLCSCARLLIWLLSGLKPSLCRA